MDRKTIRGPPTFVLAGYPFSTLATNILQLDRWLMKRPILLAIILLIGGILLLGAYRAMHAPDESSAASAKHRVGTAATYEAAQLAELRQEMARLNLTVRNQGQQLPVAGHAATSENDPPDVNGARAADPETRAEAEHRRRQYMAGLDAAFRNEMMDPRWSPVTLAMVQTAISGDDNLKLLAPAVECRSHTCRMEIVDDGTGKLGQIIPQFAQRLGQDLPSIVANHVEESGGRATTILYMSRPETVMTP
jgi:hypothetical protein